MFSHSFTLSLPSYSEQDNYDGRKGCEEVYSLKIDVVSLI